MKPLSGNVSNHNYYQKFKTTSISRRKGLQPCGRQPEVCEILINNVKFLALEKKLYKGLVSCFIFFFAFPKELLEK